MQINRIDMPQYPGYTTYEVLDPDIQEGVWYLAINNDTKLVNIYNPRLNINGKGGKSVNMVDVTTLKYRTDILSTVTKDGVLVFNSGKDLDKLILDLLGEYAPIVLDDMKIPKDAKVNAALGMSLNPKNPTDEVDFSKFNSDPYAGVDPYVIDILRSAGVSDDYSGDYGSSAGDDEEPIESEEEDIPPNDKEEEDIPPNDKEEEDGVQR